MVMNFFWLGLLSELGDRTFVLTVMLAVWCPFRGIRSSEWRCLQQLLVMLGTCTALAWRTAMVLLEVNVWRWDMRSEVVATVMLVFFSMKALIDFHHQEKAAAPPVKGDDLPSRSQCTVHAPLGGSLSGVKMYDPEANTHTSLATPGAAVAAMHNQAGIPSDVSALQSTGDYIVSSDKQVKTNPNKVTYGSTPVTAGTRAATVTAKDVASGYFSSFLSAFGVPLMIVSITEAEDKSQGAFLLMATRHEVMTPVFLGFIAAAAVATLAGVVLERQLQNQRLLYMLSLAFGFMGLTTLSQALLHLRAVSP